MSSRPNVQRRRQRKSDWKDDNRSTAESLSLHWSSPSKQVELLLRYFHYDDDEDDGADVVVDQVGEEEEDHAYVEDIALVHQLFGGKCFHYTSTAAVLCVAAQSAAIISSHTTAAATTLLLLLLHTGHGSQKNCLQLEKNLSATFSSFWPQFRHTIFS